MRELGVLGHASYKVTALLDHLAMISIVSEKYGGLIDCKPLAFIWTHAAFAGSGWGPHNTARARAATAPRACLSARESRREPHGARQIMFDDLRRNFVMNPQSGLKIRPFRHAHQARATDDELVKLTRYLQQIAPLDDFSALDHRRWEAYKPPRT